MRRRVPLLVVASTIAAGALAIALPSASSAPAGVVCTRIAAPGGNDSQSGTKRRPFATVQRLADSLRAGQTGCLRAGIYDQPSTPGNPYVLEVRQGGARGAPVVIRSFPGERARLRGIVVVEPGSNNVLLRGLAIEGMGEQNTVKIYGADVTVADSDITNAGRGSSCVILGNADAQAVRPLILRNRIHDCGSNEIDYNHQHGIYVANAVGGLISGNVIWNMAAKAIQLYPNAQRMRVARNIVDGGPPSIRGSVIIGGNSELASNGNIVERNVIAYARTHNVESRWEGDVGSGNVVRNNCLWGGVEGNIGPEVGFTAAGNVVAPPQFANRAARDYRLRPRSRCRAILEQR